MQIREFLQLPSSRLNAEMLADKLEEEQELFGQVWDIMLEDRNPVSMRAAWALSIYGRKNPGHILVLVDEIIGLLPRIKSQSIRRSLLNMLCLVQIPPEKAGVLFDYCFNLIDSLNSGIAHKAYAMTILYNISELEPELKPELLSLFESQLESDSAGIIARSRNLIHKLKGDLGRPGLNPSTAGSFID